MELQTSKSEDKIVWIHNQENRVIFYSETYTTTKEQLDLNFDAIDEITESLENFFLIIDLTKASRPNAALRHHLFKKFKLIEDKLSHLAIFTGKNLLLNMAATFVIRKAGVRSFSIHKTLIEAEKAIEEFGQ